MLVKDLDVLLLMRHEKKHGVALARHARSPPAPVHVFLHVGGWVVLDNPVDLEGGREGERERKGGREGERE